VNFDELWNYYFDKLFDEYVGNYQNKHPNEEDVGIASLEHLTYRVI
jgi:hypothetical protein